MFAKETTDKRSGLDSSQGLYIRTVEEYVKMFEECDFEVIS